MSPPKPAIIPQESQRFQTQAQRCGIGRRPPGHMVQDKQAQKNTAKKGNAGKGAGPLPQVWDKQVFFSLQADTPRRIS